MPTRIIITKKKRSMGRSGSDPRSAPVYARKSPDDLGRRRLLAGVPLFDLGEINGNDLTFIISNAYTGVFNNVVAATGAQLGAITAEAEAIDFADWPTTFTKIVKPHIVERDIILEWSGGSNSL